MPAALPRPWTSNGSHTAAASDRSMAVDVRHCSSAAMSLLLLLLGLQPIHVASNMNCSDSDPPCPIHYVCCYHGACCFISERVAEIAGIVVVVMLLFATVVKCLKSCMTRRPRANIHVMRAPATNQSATSPAGDAGEHNSDTSPLIQGQPTT